MSRKKVDALETFYGLPDRLRKVRGNLSQEEFGKVIGVQKSTISRYEAGRVPDLGTLKKIANFGKVDIEWLLKDDQSTKRIPQLRDFSQEEYVSSLNPLETALLIEVVTTVEAVLTSRKLQFTPDRKARLIVRTYDDCRAQKLPPTRHHVEKLLYLVD